MNQATIKPKFYVLAGTESAGKTSVINELAKRGFQYVEEAARKVIAQYEQEHQGKMLEDAKITYCERLIEQSIKDYIDNQHKNDVIFFDRGLPDAAYASSGILGKVPEATHQAIKNHRYHSRVFFFPPWEEIYNPDGIRQVSFSQIQQSYNEIKKAYVDYQYEIVEVPKVDIKGRVNFILNELDIDVSE